MTLGLRKVRDLRYGENPHQAAAWYADEPGSASAAPSAAGQGALVHQPAGPRRGAAHRARVQRAGGGVHQAHQPVRRGHRVAEPPMPTSARARPIRSSAFGGIVGLNRPIDAETARAIVSTLHRRGDRAGGRRRRARDPGDEAQHAGRDRRLRSAGAADDRASCARFSAPCWCRTRDRVVEAASPWPSDDLRVVTKRQPTRRSGRRCALPGGCART